MLYSKAYIIFKFCTSNKQPDWKAHYLIIVLIQQAHWDNGFVWLNEGPAAQVPRATSSD